jgi:hypothetical protein
VTQIKDVAVAAWRLEKWLAVAVVEKKMPARSAIRTIKSFLLENGVEVQDLTGTKFDSGLNVDVINNEAPDASDEDLVITEMIKPIVLQNGAVVSRGSVIISALPREEETAESEKNENAVAPEKKDFAPAEPMFDMATAFLMLQNMALEEHTDKTATEETKATDIS